MARPFVLVAVALVVAALALGAWRGDLPDVEIRYAPRQTHAGRIFPGHPLGEGFTCERMSAAASTGTSIRGRAARGVSAGGSSSALSAARSSGSSGRIHSGSDDTTSERHAAVSTARSADETGESANDVSNGASTRATMW